jgi:hypothetical protein
MASFHGASHGPGPALGISHPNEPPNGLALGISLPDEPPNGLALGISLPDEPPNRVLKIAVLWVFLVILSAAKDLTMPGLDRMRFFVATLLRMTASGSSTRC